LFLRRRERRNYFKNNPLMVKQISNDQNKERDKSDLSEVYRLDYKQCDSVYIGETEPMETMNSGLENTV
jgi:hypothetical protein